MCYPKREGGLGLSDFSLFNQTLIAKQCWKIITQANSLIARFFKFIYFTSSSFQETSFHPRNSMVWKGILWGKQLLDKGLGWRIENDSQIPIINSNWLPGKTTLNFILLLDYKSYPNKLLTYCGNVIYHIRMVYASGMKV